MTTENLTRGSTETMDELFKNMNGHLKQKNIKKMIKKAQKDPKAHELFMNLQKTLLNKNSSTTSSTSTPKDRIREQLKQCRLQRGGRNRQQLEAEKQTEKNEEKKKNEDTNAQEGKEDKEVQEKISETISNTKTLKKKKNGKLRQLKKKYGIITQERWTQALKNISENTLSKDEIIHERHIVELYVKQTGHVVEQTIKEESESDGELVDIEDTF